MTSDTKSTFFRQSGWMIVATLGGGVCMFAVHVFAPFLGDAEYGLFGTLLAMLNLLMIPAIGLQTVFAQQTAAAISPESHARLTGTVRGVLLWSFVLWSVMAGLVAIFHQKLLTGLRISNSIALVIIVFLGLMQLWTPVLLGVVQGRQNFLWLGWAAIVNGLGRFLAVGIIVIVLGGRATGAITGALIGVLAAAIIGIVQSRPVWQGTALPFDWKSWLGRVVPLTVGLGASQFILSADMIFVRGIFGENQTGYYSASGMIGRGLVMFTAPLTLVMFPKIVQGLSHGKKTNVLGYTLFTTLVLGALGAAACTLVSFGISYALNSPAAATRFVPATLVSKLTENPGAALFLAKHIPWFVWCMLPLALANVLLNNLMASQQFRVVPYLVIVVACYVTAVVSLGDSFVHVIQILGVFNVVFLAVIGGFTWAGKRSAGGGASAGA